MFLGEPTHAFEMYRLAARAELETENRQPTLATVFASPILPRWFSNQWHTDSLITHTIFYFL